ncbi:MAG: hypothetical protein KF894_26795 [Labilithrix sp.]|nr:hypothetical protein [Labilithrix sp.]
MLRARWSRSRSASAHLFGAFAASAGLCLPVTAVAGSEPIALRYEASGVCPGESAFVAWVEAHTRRWTRVPDASAAVRSIHVRVAEGAPEASGSLTVRSAGGGVTERAIGGPTCAEVAEALAVMVAVAIDPRAGSGSSDADSSGSGSSDADSSGADSANADSAEAGSSGMASDERAPRPQGEETAAPRARRPPSRRSERPAAPLAAGRPRFAVDARAETTSAVLRGALPGIGASLAVEPPASAPRSGIRVSDPSVAAGIRQSFTMDRSLRGGSVGFSWTAGHLRLCPLRIVIDARVEVSPCAEANAGSLRASARGFAEARGTSTFWLDLGASLVSTVSLTEKLFLSSTFLVAMPLFRQPFALASGAPVASVPPLGVLGGLGFGFRM